MPRKPEKDLMNQALWITQNKACGEKSEGVVKAGLPKEKNRASLWGVIQVHWCVLSV